MAASLKELVNILRQDGYNLVAGMGGIHRPVCGIANIENEEAAVFLEGGEITYITGTALKNPQELLPLVQFIYNKRASALFVAVGKYIRVIPEEVTTYCNDAHLPLFVIQWKSQSLKKLNDIRHVIFLSEDPQHELDVAISNAINYPDKPEKYVPIMEKYQFKADWAYCVGTIEYFSYNPDTKEKKWLKYHAQQIVEYLDKSCPRSCFIALNGVFICIFAGYEDQTVRDIIMDIYQKMRPTNLFEYVYLGIGEKVDNIMEISRSYHQALFVSMLKKKNVLKIPVLRFNSLGFYKILGSVCETEILDSYYKYYLEPVIQYDELHQTDYFLLLQHLIANDFNIAKTAAQSYMHRNSINYKLNKIQGILNCDVSLVEDRACLLEAYKIWCVLYKDEDIPDRRKRKPPRIL